MPNDGAYILTSVGFSHTEEPALLLQHDNEFIAVPPLRQSFTMRFDTTTRYCTGWRDITSGERFTCPDSQIVVAKYEQCPTCQKRTGFNPAFYHSTSVSAQQQARNQEPHKLYLAYFGPGVIKVGITHAKRGNSRLLEQGARAAIILGTFSSALIARQHEERIANLPGVAETIQLRKKLTLMAHQLDARSMADELTEAAQHISTKLDADFQTSHVMFFDSTYFPDDTPDLSSAHSQAHTALISGNCIGLMGSILFCIQQENTFFLPLKPYVGYLVHITAAVTPIQPPAQQTSLF